MFRSIFGSCVSRANKRWPQIAFETTSGTEDPGHICFSERFHLIADFRSPFFMFALGDGFRKARSPLLIPQLYLLNVTVASVSSLHSDILPSDVAAIRIYLSKQSERVHCIDIILCEISMILCLVALQESKF